MNLIASKKKASVFIGITFLLLAVVLLTACDDTYQPLESINAEQLIPCPDEIVFGSHTLSGEARRALYDLFVDQFDLDQNKLELYTFSSEAQRKLIEKNCMVISFHFYTPRKILQGFESEQLYLNEDFEFDQIKILLNHSNGLFIEYYCDGQLYLFQGTSAALHHVDFEMPNNVYTLFESAMAEGIIGLMPPTVSEAEPAVSHAFPAVPDTMVLYLDGRAVTLEGTEKTMIFEMIAPFFTTATSPGFVSQESSSVPALDLITGRAFVELRYDTPQKYVADTVTENVSGSSAATITYESLLLAFSVYSPDVTNPCTFDDYHVIYMREGKYDWRESYNFHRSYTSDLTLLYAYMYMRTCF